MNTFTFQPISAEFLVVETLDAVSADLLVGLDIISSAGGVRLDYGEEPGVLTQVVFGERAGRCGSERRQR